MNNSKARPVLVVAAVLAALQILTAGAAFADFVGKDVTALIILGIAAIQGGMGFYTQSKTVPYEDAAAYVNSDGAVVAGPASPPRIVNGTPVAVTPHT